MLSTNANIFHRVNVCIRSGGYTHAMVRLTLDHAKYIFIVLISEVDELGLYQMAVQIPDRK